MTFEDFPGNPCMLGKADGIMPGYLFRFSHKEEVAKGTMAFYFSKPEGFQFKAGQFLNLMIDRLSHAFTIASAPYESEIMIATRMRDTAFKGALLKMPVGSPVQVRGPFGTMTLHEDSKKPAVFLTGGIGITPFRSILLQAAKDHVSHRFFLFYSNRRLEDAPFFQELELLQQKNKNYILIATMTAEDIPFSWKGEKGYVSKEMLVKYLGKALSGPVYYIAGPPGLVSSMMSLLKGEGIKEAEIRAEEFSGY